MNESLHNIDSVIFDFGGTLDTDGVHWSEKFWDIYQKAGIHVSKSEYEIGYRNAEPDVGNTISSYDSFHTTLLTQISFQFKHLIKRDLLPKADYSKQIIFMADECYKDVKKCMTKSKIILELLSKKYALALVSNFYGNVEFVCKEFGIKKYFDSIIDSSEIGISKPDPGIFSSAINALKTNAWQCVVIGDSYSRDIIPAKTISCTTVWLDGRSYSRPSVTSDADYIIDSIDKITHLLL